jgi:hypothetical protein
LSRGIDPTKVSYKTLWVMVACIVIFALFIIIWGIVESNGTIIGLGITQGVLFSLLFLSMISFKREKEKTKKPEPENKP